MVVRDVKPRIRRDEYLTRMDLEEEKRGLSSEDLDEVGNVAWLEITVTGFEDRKLILQYGLYDLDAREALLPGTSKSVPLKRPASDVQKYFFAAWVGYPRSRRFKAEFRLIDVQEGGVQQLASTGPMKEHRFVTTASTASSAQGSLRRR